MYCDSYKVYHVTPSTRDHIAFLMDLEKNPEVDFWTESRRINKAVDLMIAPLFQAEFEEQLAKQGIQHSVIINDVEE